MVQTIFEFIILIPYFSLDLQENLLCMVRFTVD